MKNAVHADQPTLCPSCRALRLAVEHGKVVPHLSNEGFYEELVTGKIKMKRAPRFKFHDEADANKSRPARKRRRVHASAEPEVEGEGESDSCGDSFSTSSSSSSTSSSSSSSSSSSAGSDGAERRRVAEVLSSDSSGDH